MKVSNHVVFKWLVDSRLANYILLLELFFLTKIINIWGLWDEERKIGFDLSFEQFTEKSNRIEGVFGEEKS